MLLNPEAQLAAATGQLQQDATAMNLGTPGFSGSVQETATALTMGVTNIGLPAMGLMASIGLTAASSTSQRRIDQMLANPNSRLAQLQRSNPRAARFMQQRMHARALDPLAMGAVGARTGGRIGTALGGSGLGRIGTALGGAGGVLGGFMAPLAVGEVYNWAGDQMIQGQREFLANRQTLQQLPMQSPFGASSILGGQTSMPTDPFSVNRFGSNLANIGSQFGASTSQMRNITGALGNMGAVDTRSVASASASIRSAMQELKQIGRQIDGDLQEAMQTYQQLKSMGFDSTRQRMRALRGMSSASSLSGLSMDRVQNLTTQTMQAAQQVGLTANQGMNLGLNAISNAAVRQSQNLINPSYLNRVGGLEGYAQRMAQLQLGVLGSEGAQVMMSNLFGNDGSGRSAGMDRMMSGRGMRARGSFFRNADPYEMAQMQQQMGGSMNGLMLARIQAIRARHADDPVRANREQYNFMSSLGIQDPQEQLELISNIRSQPRAQAARIGQQFRDASTMAQARTEDPATLAERFADAINRLTRSAIGGAEEFQRFGAHLQARAEQAVSSAYQSVLGGARGMESGDFSSAGMSAARGRFLRGELSMGGNPMRRLERMLDTDATMQQALSNFGGITGGFNTDMGQGLGNRLLFQAGSAMASITGRAGGRGSFADAFGGRTGMTGGPGSGINVGTGALGQSQFATGAEFLQMAAMQQGGFLNPETMRMQSANQDLVSQMVYNGFGSAESAILEQLRPRNGGILGGLGFSMDQASQHTVGLDRDVQLSRSELDQIRSNPSAYLDQFAQSQGARNFGELSPDQQSSMLQALAQSGGQIGTAVAEGMNVNVNGSMNEFALASSVYQTAAVGGVRGIMRGGAGDSFATTTGTLRDFTSMTGANFSATEMGLRGGITAGARNLSRSATYGGSRSGLLSQLFGQGDAGSFGITLGPGESIDDLQMTGAQYEAMLASAGMTSQIGRIRQFESRNAGSQRVATEFGNEMEALIRDGRGSAAVGEMRGSRLLGQAMAGEVDAAQMIRDFVTGGSGFGDSANQQNAAMTQLMQIFRFNNDAGGLESLVSELGGMGLEGDAAQRLQQVQQLTQGGIPIPGADRATIAARATQMRQLSQSEFESRMSGVQDALTMAQDTGAQAILQEQATQAMGPARIQAAQRILEQIGGSAEELRAAASGTMTDDMAQSIIERARGENVDLDPMTQAIVEGRGGFEQMAGAFSSMFGDDGRITQEGLRGAMSLPGAELSAALFAAQGGNASQLSQLPMDVQDALTDIFGVESVNDIVGAISDGVTTSEQSELENRLLPAFALGSVDRDAQQERQFREDQREVYRLMRDQLGGTGLVVRIESMNPDVDLSGGGAAEEND